MFQGVRQGSVLYILKKGEQPQLSTAQVVSVSNPYPSPKAPNIFGQQNSVVDIQVKQGSENMVFKEMPALDGFTVSPDGTAVSDNTESMLTEIRNLHRTSQQIVESAPLHQKLLPVYEGFYDILDPNLAKEREKDKRLNKLEEEMQGMKGTLTDIHQFLLTTWNKDNESSKN